MQKRWDDQLSVRVGIVVVLLAGAVAVPGRLSAGSVIREGTSANAAGLQAIVDQFRADLGDPNNGNAVGTQLAGRREINWDGGGAGAAATQFASPMTTFSNRGAVFTTPGTAFEISGQPTPEFGDVDPGYPALFATFSSPRLFTPLASNVTDVFFFVPGSTTIRAAVTGFGAVFTDVDTAGATRMEFYDPDGRLLLQRAVPAAIGNETLSFLGVSFDAGELVGLVRIITGKGSPGFPESGGLDIVVMDDFLYGEPVATQGLTISPGSGPLFTTENFDLLLALVAPAGATITGGAVTFDGNDVGPFLVDCIVPGTLVAGGQTWRCAGVSGGVIGPGTHVLNVRLDFNTGESVRNAVVWEVRPNTEP